MIFKNRPVRRAFAVLGILFLIFLLAGCAWSYQSVERQTRREVQRSIALVGGMSAGKSVSALSIVTGEIDPEDYQQGLSVVKETSYPNAGLSLYPDYEQNLQQSLLYVLCWTSACFGMLAFFLYLAFFSVYKSFRQLTRTAESIVRGEETVLPAGGEGEEAAMRFAVASMAKQLQFQNRSLREDKEFLKNFLSDVSHQLKTPLSALRMYNEILLAKPLLDLERRNDFIERSRDQIDRTDWLIQGLLKMARVEAGAVTMKFTDAFLIDTVHCATASFQEAARQKGVFLVLSIESSIHFYHDSQWVAEAVGNLVKNAIEHTPPGGRVTVTATETPLTVTLEVQDNGAGMESTEIPHIFERFYRKSGETVTASVGIGLSLARQIFEQNYGDIHVKSAPGEGSAFQVTFLKGAYRRESGS